MKKIIVFHLVMFWFVHQGFADVETSGWVRSYLSSADQNSDGVFSWPESSSPYFRSIQNMDAIFKIQNRGLNLEAYFDHTAKVSKMSTETKSSFRVNEFFYQSSNGAFSGTFGKRTYSWGYGEAFRPLDVIQRRPRLSVIQPSIEGEWSLGGSMSDQKQGIEWVLSRSEKPLSSMAGEKEWEPTFSIQSNTIYTGGDALVIAHWRESQGFSIGLGTSVTSSEASYVYGSFLIQERFQKSEYKPLSSNLTPLQVSQDTTPMVANANEEISGFQNSEGHYALKANVGINYTFESEVNLISEFWYDGTAPSKNDWNSAIHQLQTLKQQANINPTLVPLYYRNLASSSLVLSQRESLARENLYLRASVKKDDWEPAVDILLAPNDSSTVTSFSLGRTSGNFRFDSGYRSFGGPKSSIYQNLPDSRLYFLSLKYFY